MLLRPFLNDASSCASYLFGCTSHNKLAVVDPHADLVDDYLAASAAVGSPIVAVFETHVQADHVSGLQALVERTGATAYLPAGAGVGFEHVALADGDVVELGNTRVAAIATPGHAPAHHAYTVADKRRGTDEPWLVFSGDALLIGDVGRPDLHVAGDAHGQARPAGQRPPVRAPRRPERARRRHGRAGAKRAAAGRKARLRPRLDLGDPRLRRRLRRRQSPDQPRRRRPGRQVRTQTATRPRLAHRIAGAAADRHRALLVVHRRGQPAARRQPGAGLVDDRGDED